MNLEQLTAHCVRYLTDRLIAREYRTKQVVSVCTLFQPGYGTKEYVCPYRGNKLVKIEKEFSPQGLPVEMEYYMCMRRNQQ